jgi:hypothetical protein
MSFDLDSMKQEWRGGIDRGISAEEITKIASALRAQTARMWLLLGLEIFATICTFGFFLWLAKQADSMTGRVFYGLLAAAAAPMQVWSLRLRRGLWRAVQDTPAAYLRLQVDRARRDIRIARLTLIGIPLGSAIGLAIGYWGPSSGALRSMSVNTLFGISVGGTAVLLLIVWVAWRTLKGQRLLLEQALRLLSELDE